MTRTRNSAFVGTTHGDADIDAVNFTRVLREINQDLNRAYDVFTGANSIGSESMAHDGTAGRGSLLGVPSVNQTINARIVVTTP